MSVSGFVQCRQPLFSASTHLFHNCAPAEKMARDRGIDAARGRKSSFMLGRGGRYLTERSIMETAISEQLTLTSNL